MLAGGQAGVEAARVGQDAHARLSALRIAHDVYAVHFHVSTIAAHEPVEHAQRRRFARAVGPQQAGNLTVGHVKVHPVDGGYCAKVFLQALNVDHGAVSSSVDEP